MVSLIVILVSKPNNSAHDKNFRFILSFVSYNFYIRQIKLEKKHTKLYIYDMLDIDEPIINMENSLVYKINLFRVCLAQIIDIKINNLRHLSSNSSLQKVIF